MKITITIKCDNDAFQPYPEPEVSRILQHMAGQLPYNNIYSFDRLRDSNGNCIGHVTITEDSDHGLD